MTALLAQRPKTASSKFLKSYMKISGAEADELLTQMRWTVKDLVQPETALVPMTNILTGKLTAPKRDDL